MRIDVVHTQKEIYFDKKKIKLGRLKSEARMKV
jgi:hypothetical protein